MRVRIILILLALAVVGCVRHHNWETKPTCPKGSGVIVGTVTDSVSGDPVVGVSVALLGTDLGDLSSPNGEYQICSVPEGYQTLRFTSIGHRSIETDSINVTTGDTVTVDQVMVKMDSTERANRQTIFTETSRNNLQPITNADEILSQEAKVRTNTEGEVFVDGEKVGEISYTILNTPDSTSTIGGITDSTTSEPAAEVNTTAMGDVFIRGGRNGEVTYIVDGTSPSDPIGGSGVVYDSIQWPDRDDSTGSITDSTTADGRIFFHGRRGWIEYLVDGQPPGLSSIYANDSTGSITVDSIDAKVTLISDEINRQPVTTVEAILEQVAGVETSETGEIIIRGGWPRTPDSICVLQGAIIDLESSDSLAGASVSIVGDTVGTVTDLQGWYFLEKLDPGQYSLKIEVDKYVTTIAKNLLVVCAQGNVYSIRLRRKASERKQDGLSPLEIDTVDADTLSWEDKF